MKVITPNIVCLSAKLQRSLFTKRVVRNSLNVTNSIYVCFPVVFFSLFETVCQCLEVLVCKCVFVCVHVGVAGVHMCVTMIATLHSGKTNTSRDPYIHSRGSFINQTAVHLSTHSIFFFFFFLLHGITRWSGSAKNPLGAAQREGEQCV